MLRTTYNSLCKNAGGMKECCCFKVPTSVLWVFLVNLGAMKMETNRDHRNRPAWCYKILSKVLARLLVCMSRGILECCIAFSDKIGWGGMTVLYHTRSQIPGCFGEKCLLWTLDGLYWTQGHGINVQMAAWTLVQFLLVLKYK